MAQEAPQLVRDPLLFDDSIPLVERVRRAFGESGAIARSNAHFRRRDGQTAFAEAVAQALESKGTLVAEAGTGTGKTFAYLTPALLSGATVIISTAGKPLQDQLFEKDIPQLSRALGVHVPTAVLKGRANYICLYRLEQTETEGWLPEKDSFEKLRRIRRFADSSATGDRAELSGIPEDDPLWPMVTSTRESCLGSERCPYWQQCFVRAAREKALASQIVVVNHHLYLSSLAVKASAGSAIEGLLPAASLTVIDEAHQLPAIASDFFGTSFSTYQLDDIASEARAIGMSRVRDGAKWDELYTAVQKTAYDLNLALRGLGLTEGERRAVGTIERFGDIGPALAAAVNAFRLLVQALQANKDRDDELDALREYAEEVADEVAAWAPVAAEFAKRAEAGEPPPEDPHGFVRWVSILKLGVRFCRTPLSFADDFRKMREAEGGAWVFTSATLSAGGKFSHFFAEIGLSESEAKAFSWPSPFNYWEQGCFYLPQLPAPSGNAAEHAERVVEAAWPLVNAAGGRTFFLCTSLAAVASAAAALRERLDANGLSYPLLVQGDMPKAALIEEFRRLGNAILVGSMSFWEGVDVRGDALSLVVIDKLPFSPPDDPVAAARCNAIRERGGNPFMAYTLPEAIISLKQGAGRLIRSETDRGVFMLCDSRAVEKRYGPLVLKSLPDFFRTRRIEKALQFFSNPEAYLEGLYR